MIIRYFGADLVYSSSYVKNNICFAPEFTRIDYIAANFYNTN